MSDVSRRVCLFGYGTVHQVLLYKRVSRRLATVGCLELFAMQQPKLEILIKQPLHCR